VPFRLTWLVLGALAGLSPAPSGRIRRVPAEYRTIQEAIDSAEPGDTVLVAPGRYVENIRFGGKGIVVASELDAGDAGSPPNPAASARARAPALGARRADLGAYGGSSSAVLLP
jgi:hypothetical protein